MSFLDSQIISQDLRDIDKFFAQKPEESVKPSKRLRNFERDDSPHHVIPSQFINNQDEFYRKKQDNELNMSLDEALSFSRHSVFMLNDTERVTLDTPKYKRSSKQKTAKLHAISENTDVSYLSFETDLSKSKQHQPSANECLTSTQMHFDSNGAGVERRIETAVKEKSCQLIKNTYYESATDDYSEQGMKQKSKKKHKNNLNKGDQEFQDQFEDNCRSKLLNNDMDLEYVKSKRKKKKSKNKNRYIEFNQTETESDVYNSEFSCTDEDKCKRKKKNHTIDSSNDKKERKKKRKMVVHSNDVTSLDHSTEHESRSKINIDDRIDNFVMPKKSKTEDTDSIETDADPIDSYLLYSYKNKVKKKAKDKSVPMPIIIKSEIDENSLETHNIENINLNQLSEEHYLKNENINVTTRVKLKRHKTQIDVDECVTNNVGKRSKREDNYEKCESDSPKKKKKKSKHKEDTTDDKIVINPDEQELLINKNETRENDANIKQQKKSKKKKVSQLVTESLTGRDQLDLNTSNELTKRMAEETLMKVSSEVRNEINSKPANKLKSKVPKSLEFVPTDLSSDSDQNNEFKFDITSKKLKKFQSNVSGKDDKQDSKELDSDKDDKSQILVITKEINKSGYDDNNVDAQKFEKFHKSEPMQYYADKEDDRCPVEVVRKELNSNDDADLRKSIKLRRNEEDSGVIRKPMKFDNNFDSEHDQIHRALENALEATKQVVEEYEALKDLTICIPWEIPVAHTIETRMSSAPTREQKVKFKELNIPIKLGNYTNQEDNLIQGNFKEFCKMHDIPHDSTPFLNFSYAGAKLLNLEQRIKFVQYLGKGLENRMLHSIYKRFTCLYTEKKKGRFSDEEDIIILKYMKMNKSDNNKFATLSKILNRDRLAVEKRYKHTLLEQTASGKVLVNTRNAPAFIRNLLEVLELKNVYDLRDRNITEVEWKKLSDKLGEPVLKLKRAWYSVIYSRLFAHDFDDIIKNVVHKLLAAGETDFRELNWNEMAKDYEYVTGASLYYVFRLAVNENIPKHLHHHLPSILKYLEYKYKHCGRILRNRPNLFEIWRADME